ncbi:MAG: ATP-binding cassette domain-containing protein, partial [Clostridium sp.]|nr:ATP-binding cassette domain-containing protein [Clostridium sp.]
INEDTKISYLSQIQGRTLNENNTIRQEFFDAGFETSDEIISYIERYGFNEEKLDQKITSLSGGEKNMLQLAKISDDNAHMLLLDEPTSHLDTYSQIALERAIKNYNGAVIMISHDFYSIVNCMDYVLIIEDKTIRRMHIRNFRKMIYDNHFDKDYLELEKNKKSLETKIELALKDNDFILAKNLCEELEKQVKLLKK